ncbi:MAG: SoxR reducing system RseC family protein [Bacteroidales bacterium]
MTERIKDTACEPDSIKHDGIIKSMDSQSFFVSIIAQSACASCQVKGVCNVGEMQEEIVEIPIGNRSGLKVGDKVEIMMEKSLGTKAVLLGYFIPFLLLLFTLIISLSLFDNQGVAGILAVLILVPYYFALYFFRDKLKKTFIFSIR